MRNTMSDREIFRKSRVLKSEASFYKMKQSIYNKGNNKITELRTILQRESQNS